jgi:MoaA/NifB/PqqE/SkfB family radical SAM enzyme
MPNTGAPFMTSASSVCAVSAATMTIHRGTPDPEARAVAPETVGCGLLGTATDSVHPRGRRVRSECTGVPAGRPSARRPAAGPIAGVGGNLTAVDGGPGSGTQTGLERYHATRDVAHQPFRSACYAPFVGLSFDVNGAVSVCSFTRSTPLGRVGDRPLEAMWRGAVADRLRDAVARDDLSVACTRCAEEIDGGNLHGVVARGFDRFTADAEHPWPRRMEFALSNACDLRCVMCSGEFSSSIRSRREGLPAVPLRYGDAFLEELRPFVPHLEQARFLGGEPFLAGINHRIWELLADSGAGTECNVTTNGMHWNERIRGHLDRLPFSIGVSIDGTTAATVESIRVGASFERIMANLDRFVAYGRSIDNPVSLTFCLMVQNWHEFGDYLRLAEGLGCQVYVNTVRHPPANSLYRLPVEELRTVVGRLEASRDEVAAGLERNRDAWLEQLDRLASHLESLERDGDPLRHLGDRLPTDPHRVAALLAEPGADPDEVARRLARLAGADAVSVVRCDAAEDVVAGGSFLGEDVDGLVGTPAGALFARAAARFGHRVDILATDNRPGALSRVLVYDDPGRPPTVLASVTVAGPAPYASTRLHAVLPLAEAPPAPVPVALRGSV